MKIKQSSDIQMNVQDLMTYDSLNFKLSMYIGIFKILHDDMIDHFN